jgi:Tfp pilus assembly protein PilF
MRCLLFKLSRTAGQPLACAALAAVCVTSLAASPQTARLVARRVMPSVLTLEVYDAGGAMSGRGSAFYVAPDVVATTYHVLKGGRSASARANGGEHNFTVVGAIAADQAADLALLKLEGASGRPLPLSAREAFEPGEEVFAFGSPRGLEGSVTAGIVSSASLRSIGGAEFLQISTPTSPGSSGGPVVDGQGEVIGVAARKIEGAQSIGLAIPARALRKLVAASGPEVTPIDALPHRGAAAPAGGRGACGDGPFTLPAGRDARFYLEAGERFYDERRYAEAKEAYLRATEVDPKNAWAHFALARAYLQIGCEEKAVLANRQAVALAPKQMEFRDGLGWLLLRLERYGDAVEVYEEALRMKPKQAIARARLGISYFSLGRVTDAINAFKEAVRVDETCGLARFWLGKAYAERLGNMQGALEQYRVLKKQDAALAEEMGRILRVSCE